VVDVVVVIAGVESVDVASVVVVSSVVVVVVVVVVSAGVDGASAKAAATPTVKRSAAPTPVTTDFNGIEPHSFADTPTRRGNRGNCPRMTEALVYVDDAEVHEGALGQLRQAITELAEFVEENEPQLVSYNAYFSDDGSRMSVVHVHDDADSLDRHLEIAGPRFARFSGLVTLRSIHVYGQPSEVALKQLQDKLQLLGSGGVVVHSPHAGFIRQRVL
jgi:hypothetical protein